MILPGATGKWKEIYWSWDEIAEKFMPSLFRQSGMFVPHGAALHFSSSRLTADKFLVSFYGPCGRRS
ncbi:MAG: hypothetical protein A3I66_04340 [Burkholderiales bacterium RIFCSPLOWO2_02_FULL_57_36]|nr:MAG: hypothetical protein A3I66_04340 [Burkholderiales bacterium RIFCSPLOWO2_02_FULL_57_36]